MTVGSLAPSSRLRRRKAVADAVSGLAASLVAMWTFYPLDLIKTNFQANKSSLGVMMEYKHLLLDLYRGVGTKSLHCASSSFVYFYVYSWIMSWWETRCKNNSNSDKPSPLARLVLSAIAAMINTAITLPLDVVSSQQQTSTSSTTTTSSMKNVQHEPIVEKFDQTWWSIIPLETVEESNENDSLSSDHFYDSQESSIEEEEKNEEHEPLLNLVGRSSSTPVVSSLEYVSSLWKGLLPSLLLCSNPSINFTVFDLLKSRLLDGRTKQRHQNLSMFESFLIGLIAKFTATLITYPLIRAKILLMVTHDHKSLWGCLIREYKQNGIIRGLYKGCYFQMVHTALKSALLMMVREQISSQTNRLLLQIPPPRHSTAVVTEEES